MYASSAVSVHVRRTMRDERGRGSITGHNGISGASFHPFSTILRPLLPGRAHAENLVTTGPVPIDYSAWFVRRWLAQDAERNAHA